MVTRIKSINPVQLAAVSAVLYAFIALIGALFFAFFASLIPYGAFGMHGLGMGTGLGLFMIVLWPIVYGVLGFIGGLITALLYNLIAMWTGGIELTFTGAAMPVGTVVATGSTPTV